MGKFSFLQKPPPEFFPPGSPCFPGTAHLQKKKGERENRFFLSPF
jgi:hypothetical protein